MLLSESWGSADLSVCGHPRRFWGVIQDSILLLFEIFWGWKSEIACFLCCLAVPFQYICFEIQTRVCIDVYFGYWIVSKVSLKEAGFHPLPHGRVSAQVHCWLWGDARRQGEQEEKDDSSVQIGGQPFSKNTALFFLLNGWCWKWFLDELFLRDNVSTKVVIMYCKCFNINCLHIDFAVN